MSNQRVIFAKHLAALVLLGFALASEIRAANLPPNTAPTITAIANYSVNEDGSVTTANFTIGDAETAASSLILSAATSKSALIPVSGIVFGGSGATRNVTLIPAANQPISQSLDTATITITVSDGTLSASRQFTLTVNQVNDAPVANAQTVSANELTATAITLTGSDIEGSSLAFEIVSGPSYGTLGGSGASRTYTSFNLNNNVTDSFTFRVNDGSLYSANATVTVNVVNVVNSAPTANNQTVGVSETVATGITLSGSDPEGSALTYVITGGPSYGTLSGSGASRTYTSYNLSGPATDYVYFKVYDGVNYSGIATVTINVSAVNGAPTANGQTVNANELTATGITLSGSDPEGGALTYQIVSSPTKGSLSGSGASETYTSYNLVANTTDSFTFRVYDGVNYSAAATVNININGVVNSSPTANNQTVSASETVGTGITLSGSDPEGSTLTYVITGGPTYGTLSGSGASRTYTSYNLTGNTTDYVYFQVNDGANNSATATVTINVTASNGTPTANGQTVNVNELTATGITLTGSDPEGSVLTYQIVSGPTKGSLSGSGASQTYTSYNLVANTTDSFTFRVYDGVNYSAAATVNININGVVNSSPTANSQTVNASETVGTGITLSGSDPEGSALTYVITGGPTYGTLSGSGSSRTYTLYNLTGNTTDYVYFQVNDGVNNSATATVTINVTASNGAPTANGQTVNVSETVATGITLTGSDPEGSSLTYQVMSAPTKGSLSGTGASQTYTSYNLAASTTDSFTFRVYDGVNYSANATVTINITASNGSPTISSISNQTINQDSATGALSFTVGDPETAVGSLVVTGGSSNTGLVPNANVVPAGSGASRTAIVTPLTGQSGSALITLTVNDGNGGTASTSFTLTVTPKISTPQIVATLDTAGTSATNTATVIPSDAAIYYTTDGSDPTTSSTLYSAGSPPVLSATVTTKWKAFKSGYITSDTATALGVPVFSPGSGTYTVGQNVTITAPSGAQLKVLQLNPNLLDPSTWVLGSQGSQTGFGQNGDTAGENVIETRRTPYGTAEKVWVGYNLDTPTGDPGADGGWNAAVAIDKTKLYRFSVWMRKLDNTPASTSGYSYLGCGWSDVSDLTGTSTDSVNGNPYFWAAMLPLNDWYLVVGYVHPAGDLTTTHSSKMYNTAGQVVSTGTDFRWLPTTTTTYHRSYLYYCTELGIQQEFWNPRVEVVSSVNDPIDVLFATPESSPKTIALSTVGARTIQALSYSAGSTSSGVISSQYQVNAAITDTDGDGLSDSWETLYFGNLNQTASGDWDGDGFTNLQEYQNGTNPTSYNGLIIFTPLE